MERVKWERTHSPITEQIISKIEEKFNVTFHQDYKECIMVVIQYRIYFSLKMGAMEFLIAY